MADDEEDANGLPRVVSIRTGGGRNVTLTLPDGRRTTFSFKPRVTSSHAYAEWEAPPGVRATLKPWPDSAGVINYYPLSWAQGGWNSTFENYDLPGWVLETQDGTKYFIERGPANKVIWDDTGEGHFINVTAYGEPNLTRIEQRGGDVIKISPDAIRHVTAATNPTRSVWFERDNAGRITAIRDPNSGSNGLPTVRYVYNRDTGNLIQVHRLVDRSAGSYLTNRYHYNHPRFPHYITSIEDPRGVPRVRTLYGDDGKLVGMIDAAGRTNLFEHDITNQREIVYDRSGQPTVFAYDTRGNVIATMNALGHTNGFAYDENGFLTNSVDALGNRTVYSNDASGNVLSVTVPYPVGAAPANYTTSFTWDEFGNQTSMRLPTGGMITNEFDANGNLSAVRDEWGNLISSTVYNSVGLPVAETDRFGSLGFGYDSSGNLTRMTNSLNQVVTSGFDSNGNLTSLVDNGVTNSIAYDALNRETSADYGHGVTVAYGHEDEGDWRTVSGPTLGSMERRMDEQGRLSGWTTANGSTPGFAYDINGRLEFETNSIGAVTRSVYNAVGWLVGTTNLATGAWAAYGHDAAGRKVAQTNSLGQVTLFDYWPSGSLKAMTNALGTNYWLYSDAAGACSGCGNSGSVTDSLGRVTESVTSSHGLPLQTIRRASAGATGANAATNTITYLAGMTTPEQEAEQYPVSITDEGNRTRQYEYTALGQLYRATDLSGATWWTNRFDTETGALTNVVSPTGESLGYTFDKLDNVKTIRFGDGNCLTNFFNSENRLSGVRLPSGTLLTNVFDFAGRLTNRQARVSGVMTETASFEYNGNDAVTRMTDNTGSTTNLFDSAGRLWGIDYPSGASVRYELDLLDRISAVTNKASAGGTAYVTRYQRDPVGNVTSVIDPFNGNTSFEYDRVGRRTKRALPNGIVTEWRYNWKDQVTNIVHKTSGGSILASVLYERAAGGEPTKITREDGSYVLLAYDNALRLTNEVYYSSGGAPQTTNGYGFDASGSRIRLVKGGTTLTNAVTAGYRITQVKNGAAVVESYTYDNGGRVAGVTRDGVTRTFGYNSTDQVTAATNGASWITYRHDANGRRTISTNSAGTVRRFMVAPTPETDLESPHRIANAAGTIHQAALIVSQTFFGNRAQLRQPASHINSDEPAVARTLPKR